MLKDELLEVLENNRGCFVNGTKLAQKLFISRNAVSKAAKVLSEEGYKIKSAPNKGYMLSGNILSVAGIKKFLDNDFFDLQLFNTIDSTNNETKRQGRLGAKEGLTIVARSQTGGKGRRGRTFFSPLDSGVYFSILVRPNITLSKSLYLTTLSAVAVSRAIEKVFGLVTQIKWVNDIFYLDKKVCGILTEGETDIENNKLNFAVVGIGININRPKGGFPQEITHTATNLKEDCLDEANNKLIATVLNYFYAYYKNLADKTFLEEYRLRSFLTGKTVKVNEGRVAFVEGIDDEFNLIVKYSDQTKGLLNSGEVSVKL